MHGVHIVDGEVVGTRSFIVKDVSPHTIVDGTVKRNEKTIFRRCSR